MSRSQLKIPPPLSAQNKSSFAYKTIKDRLPCILVKTIDFLHRQRKELHKYGMVGTEQPTENELTEIEQDAKTFISQITKLRKDVETNKELTSLEKLSLEVLTAKYEYFNDDIELWNKSLEAHKLNDGVSMPLWFESPWLLVECYMYRKLKEAALMTKHLKMFDPFVEQKQSSCKSALSQMTTIANHLKVVEEQIRASPKNTHPSERSEFSLFTKLALWANKCDLSISGLSAEKAQTQKFSDVSDIKEHLEELDDNILCDNMSEIWFKIQAIRDQLKSQESGGPMIYLDLVADNAGYELFVDLCLIHFLTLVFCTTDASSSRIKFRIHLKRMPWFVSDALEQDLDWLLTTMKNDNKSGTVLSDLSLKWESYFASELWEVHSDRFWTLPHDYSEMKDVAGDLYSHLSESKLIIFKGDLNYRKLVGDRQWHLLTPFRVALRGFEPAPLATLRTTKADVVVGIEDINIYARINNNELPRDWMISGDYGLVQYLDPF